MAKIISSLSISGGQGKTTTTLFLGKWLAEQGINTLLIDSDPQGSLTQFAGLAIAEDDPTLLELIKEEISLADACYEVGENLGLIPADRALQEANSHLAKLGYGSQVLRKLLKEDHRWDVIIIDVPPQRSELTFCAIGAAESVIIPVEAAPKGLRSLLETVELVQEFKAYNLSVAEIMGYIPFRDRWVAMRQTKQSRDAIQAMQEMMDERGIQMFPSIPESEKFKQAIEQYVTPWAITAPSPTFATPFKTMGEAILGSVKVNHQLMEVA